MRDHLTHGAGPVYAASSASIWDATENCMNGLYGFASNALAGTQETDILLGMPSQVRHNTHPTWPNKHRTSAVAGKRDQD